MRLELEELWLQEQLSRCLDESLLVRLLTEFTEVMVDGIDARLPGLDQVAIGGDLHQDRATQRAVEPEIHHLQCKMTQPFHDHSDGGLYAFSALTLLAGHQKELPACKN